MIESDLFVQIFGGAKYADAASVVAILAIGNLFYTGTGPTGYVLSMTGRPGVNFANSIVAVALYAGLGAVVVPDHGAVGMAVVDAIVTALVNSARVVEAWILVGVQPFGKSFVKPVVATVTGAVALLLWQAIGDDAVWVHIAGIVVAAGVYLATLVLLGMDDEEKYVWARIRARAFRGRS
jgi:O-antigen/teichoic acid export membrane protein